MKHASVEDLGQVTGKVIPRDEALAGRRSFVQDALALMTNRVTIMALSFLSGIVLARSLGADGRGVIAAIMVYPGIFLSFVQMGVRQSTLFHVGRHLDSDSRIVGGLIALFVVSSTVGMALTGAWLWLIGNPNFTPLLICLATLSIPLTLIRDYGSGFLLGKRLVGQFTGIQRLAELQRFLLVVVLVWWVGAGIWGAMLATLLSSLLVGITALRKVANVMQGRPSPNWLVMRSLVGKGLGYAVAVFVSTLNYRAGVALMERQTDAVEIGIYTVAVAFAMLVQTMPMSIGNAIFAHGASAKDEVAFARKVGRLFRVTLVGSLGMVVALVLLAPVALPLLYGHEFVDSAYVLILLLPGLFCRLGPTVLNMDLAARGRPKVTLWVSVPVLCLNVALNLWLVPGFGAYGAAMASSIAYGIGGTSFVLLYCSITGLTLRELLHYERTDFEFLRRLRFPGKKK